jgi:hypothetical protein
MINVRIGFLALLLVFASACGSCDEAGSNPANNGEVDDRFVLGTAPGYAAIHLRGEGDGLGPSVRVVDFSTQTIVYETPDDIGGIQAHLSADGSRLAFTGKTAEERGVYYVDLPDGEPAKVPLAQGPDAQFAQSMLSGMSADGSRILFQCSASTEADGVVSGLCLWSNGSTELVEAPGLALDGRQAVLSADGTIAAVRINDEVHRIELDTGDTELVYDYAAAPDTTYPNDAAVPHLDISDDGAVIALSGNNDDGRAIAIVDGTTSVASIAYPLTDPSRGTGFALSSDGSQVAYNVEGELRLRTLASGDERVLGTLFGAPAWVDNDAGVASYWTDPEDSHIFEVRYHDLGDGEQVLLARAEERGLEDLLFRLFRWGGM